jgi:hypothetical protein
MFGKNLKKAIEMFFSLKSSLLVLILQLLSEVILVDDDDDATEKSFQQIPSGCYGCTYLHGQIINGNLLVCGIHPFGLDDCPDYEKILTISLTHKSCRLSNFFLVCARI